MNIDLDGLSLEAFVIQHAPPAADTKRGPATYEGLNLTVRRYGVVVANYPSVSELAEQWPGLAAALAAKVRSEQR